MRGPFLIRQKENFAGRYWGGRGWGLQRLWCRAWWALRSAKMATNGRPPFSPPQVSKPLRLLAPLFPSDVFLLSKPSTLVETFLLLGLSTVDVSGSKAPETEGMRGLWELARFSSQRMGIFGSVLVMMMMRGKRGGDLTPR